MKTKVMARIFLILVLSTQWVCASKITLEEQRKNFLSVEKLIRKGKDMQFFTVSAPLKNYPLYPYIQYQWLVKHLDQTNKIQAFLDKNKETRYFHLLSAKWLIYLAKHQKWKLFIEHYSASKSIKLQCYFYRAKYNTGAKKEALMGAKSLWTIGKSLPNECNPIFEVLKKSPYFTKVLLWQRLDAALTNGKVALAQYIIRTMGKKDQRTAQLWLKVHQNPTLINKSNLLDPNNPQAGLIFAHGVDRLARKSLMQAINIWDAKKNTFKIDNARVQRLEQRLAMSLAYRRNKLAYSRLSQLENADESTKEWRVRTALEDQNWTHVMQSIDQLSKESKEKDKWRYWLARALEHTEKQKVANFIYTKLSTNRSFYRYLSADKLKRDYELSDHPIQVTEKMFDRFKNKTDFRVVTELINIDKLREAKRQWWYAVKKLDKKDILLAAKYAQELDWKQIAVFTIAKAKYWDDVSLRFPMAYDKLIEKNAKGQKLNPAIIYGLIRRESVFSHNVQSPVGAIGLMQIMPRTGRQIANELKDKWSGKKKLFNPSTNVKYGAYYYKKLLNQFNGHYALAAAGYNAGPHRVKKWLPVEKPIAADIWIETIPFKETRAYVSAVLTYALIYQKKLKQNLLTMKDFMRDVVPG